MRAAPERIWTKHLGPLCSDDTSGKMAFMQPCAAGKRDPACLARRAIGWKRTHTLARRFVARLPSRGRRTFLRVHQNLVDTKLARAWCRAIYHAYWH
eukprot:1187299-Prorocentrum_minimum.AAC.1